MIYLDTYLQRQTVSLMEKACNDMELAVSNLEAIKSHNDWQCREKNAINSYMDKNKKNIRLLREQTYAYCYALKNAAESMENTELNLINLLKPVETQIINALSIVNPKSSGYVPINIIAAILPAKPIKWLNINSFHINIINFLNKG